METHISNDVKKNTIQLDAFPIKQKPRSVAKKPVVTFGECDGYYVSYHPKSEEVFLRKLSIQNKTRRTRKEKKDYFENGKQMYRILKYAILDSGIFVIYDFFKAHLVDPAYFATDQLGYDIYCMVVDEHSINEKMLKLKKTEYNIYCNCVHMMKALHKHDFNLQGTKKYFKSVLDGVITKELEEYCDG